MGGPPIPPSADATLSLNLTNVDEVDYALWIQWQDDAGNLNQDFVTLLPAAVPGSFSQIIQDVPALSGFSYSLLLLDPSGSLWDALPLGTLGAGEVLPVNATIANSAFLVS